MNEEMNEVMLDLLTKKAVYGLNDEEAKQLDMLQREAGVADESLSFELAAAAIGSASVDVKERMPASLRARILADAPKHFYASPAVAVQPETPASSWFNWLGWAAAAAACIALALNVYYTRPSVVVQNPPATPTPEERLTPSQMRQRLIDTAPDLARGNWGAGKMNEIKPTGDVVWSDSKQAGYLRITGLPKNDPGKETYQLWIVAENQDPKTPVDGGTFDINSDGEVVIPIDAKVKALNPQAFAITVEKPGGVVVSTQGKLAALAKRET